MTGSLKTECSGAELFTPRPYQVDAYKWLSAVDRAALFLDVGMGKSALTLQKISDTLMLGDVSHWLVVAPKRVTETTWPQELEKWAFLNGLNYLNLTNLPGAKRAEAARFAAKNADITLINVDNITKLVQQFKTQWPWDGVVLDESSKFKDSSTKRWKAMRYIRQYTTHLIELTGSPCAQSLLSLWPQIFLLDGGERLGRTFTGFRNRYFRQVDWHGYEWEAHDWALDAIMDKISDLCLTMRAEDHMDLHEPRINPLPVVLDLKTLNRYRQLEKEYYLETTQDDAPITAPSAGVLAGKLTQMANGLVYYDTETEERQIEEFHKYKVEAALDFAEEHGDRFILAYHYQHDRDRLLEKFGKKMQVFDGTPEQLRAWEHGSFQVLGLHPQSGGHGVDGLQHYTNTVLWYAPPWSREQFDQVNGRVMGARQVGTQFEGIQPYCHLLIAQGTIDETAHETLVERGGTQAGFLKGMKDRGRQYL